MSTAPPPSPAADHLRRRLGDLAIVAVAVVGHLAVLETWWFHDDWVFLADAAGVAARGEIPVRVVSFQWYWQLLYPLFGLATAPWAWTRLVLHAGCALVTARLARHAGLDHHGGVLAGLVFAAAPVAFESVYWGSGAVELLGAFFALAALERWLAGTARARWLALLLAALAIGSKEFGLLLPVLFAADLVRRRAWRTPLAAGVAALGLVAVGAVVLLLRAFAGADDYSTEWTTVPRNFLVYGSWLATPAALLRAGTLETLTGLLTGAAFWGLWGWLAQRKARSGRRALAATLVLAVAGLAPVTVIGDHALPRYAYGPFAAAAVAIVLVIYPARGPSRRTLVLVTGLLAILAWSGVDYHRNARYASGRAFHRLVFKERVSRYLCHQYQEAGLADGDRVVIVRDASTDDEMVRMLREGGAGDLALRLTAGPACTLEWVDAVGPEHAGAFVFRTRGVHLLPQGRLPR